MKIEEALNQTKPFKDEQTKAIINLLYSSNYLMDLLLQYLKPYQINDQHYNIMRILRGRYPNAASPSDIKAVLINKRGDLTRLVDKLVKKGWAKRLTNPNSRRMVDIYLTESGLFFLDEIKANTLLQEVVKKNLNTTESQQLNYLLDKLRG